MEEALDSLRITSRRIFSSQWRLGSKSSSKKSNKTRPHLLEIPPEIRLEIYSYINPTSSFTHPLADPLYRLFFVCKFLRQEIASLFYRTPSFTFLDPRACGFFLATTKTHLHLLTGLTISVCGNDTYSLEPIFEMLVKLNVPLRSVIVKLMLVLGDSKPDRPPAEKLLSAGANLAALQEARSRARHLTASFEVNLNSLPEPVARPPLPELQIQTSEDTASNSALGMMKTIRYLAIDGHPTGDWATEFELAVLELHWRMFEVAKEEGKMVYKGPSPLPPGYTYDSYWLHNDVWIEGEEKPDHTGFLRENYGPWRRQPGS